MKLSIIIPVFNEEKTIGEIIKRVYLAKLPKNFKKEIIVIDDGSTDSSITKIKNFKKEGLKKIFHRNNMGKGAAIKSGLKISTGDYILIQDADLEYDPNDYNKLLEPVLKNKSKVVFGTRLTNYPLKIWGKDKTVLPLHLLANKFLTFLTNILYGASLTDMETCYKLCNINILKKINMKSNGFDIEPEITAKVLKIGVRIKEVPIKSTPRTYKDGKKITWTDGVIAIWTLIKYRFTN